MSTCIYIVTYPHDYLMCSWAVKSIRKFMRGDYHIAVVFPEGASAPPDCPADFFRSVPEPEGKGFLVQMCVKCEPDLYAPGYRHYVHWDSDCILTSNSHIDEFRNVCYYGPYAELFKHAGHLRLWQHAVMKCLGFTPEHEFMRCFPMSFPSAIYPSTRKRVELVTRQPFSSYVLSTRNAFPQTFAEFNTLGAWAWINHRKEVDFRDWREGPAWGWDRILQFHGPGGPDFVQPHRSESARQCAQRLHLL